MTYEDKTLTCKACGMDVSPELPVTDFSDNPTGCCPRFHPELWDGKVFRLDTYRFIRATTRSVAYMPLNMGPVMTRTQKAITDAKADSKERYLMLSRDLSKWQAEHYFLVDGDVPGYDTMSIRGTYLARVFDGPFRNMPKWMDSLGREMASSGRTLKNVYAFYTTCPKCTKTYGHNHVVLLAEMDEQTPPSS